MAEQSVFFAWQSDLPDTTSKKFIRKAAIEALKQIGKELDLDEAPRLDHDTKNVSGLPSICDTITRKIDQCSVFLADVSLVSQLIDTKATRKLSPNPNVMLELGYAWARIGWERLVLVMNLENGTQESLPFDLKNRRFPYGYRVAEDLSDIEERGKELTSHLKMAFKGAMQQEHQRVSDIIRRMDGYSIHFLRICAMNTHFWESDASVNAIPGMHDRVLIRLLELEITELVQYAQSPTGYAYTWTNIGLLVLRRLQIPTPLFAAHLDFPVATPDVEVNMSWYDDLKIPPPA